MCVGGGESRGERRVVSMDSGALVSGSGKIKITKQTKKTSPPPVQFPSWARRWARHEGIRAFTCDCIIRTSRSSRSPVCSGSRSTTRLRMSHCLSLFLSEMIGLQRAGFYLSRFTENAGIVVTCSLGVLTMSSSRFSPKSPNGFVKDGIVPATSSRPLPEAAVTHCYRWRVTHTRTDSSATEGMNTDALTSLFYKSHDTKE